MKSSASAEFNRKVPARPNNLLSSNKHDHESQELETNMSNRSILDRMADSILDRTGDIYGVDERERSVWYEGIAIAASVQWLTFPWVIAIMSWRVGPETTSILVWLLVAFYLPMFVANIYVHRHRVASVPLGWSRKRIIVTALTAIPIVIAGLGIQHSHNELDKYSVVGGVFGGCVGLAIAVVLMKHLSKRRATKLGSPQDLD
jgi:hypothetical protein